MGQILAALQRFLATPNSVTEAALLVKIPLHDLPNQLIGITTLLSR